MHDDLKCLLCGKPVGFYDVSHQRDRDTLIMVQELQAAKICPGCCESFPSQDECEVKVRAVYKERSSVGENVPLLRKRHWLPGSDVSV